MNARTRIAPALREAPPALGSPTARADATHWVDRSVAGRPLRVCVTPPELGWRHALTPDDVAWLLGFVSADDMEGLGVVRLAQPVGPQARATSTLRFHAAIVGHAGASITVDATTVGDRQPEMRLGTMERLDVEPLGGDVRSQCLDGVLRAIGHYVDVRRNVDEGPDATWSERWERYWRAPAADRRRAAERYAEGLSAALSAAGVLPFAARFDPDALRADGLHPAWFGPFAPDVPGATPDHHPVSW